MIADWAHSRRHSIQVLELALGDGLPCLDDFDALVLMGGPMNVNDETTYPWLAPEKDLVRRALLAHGGAEVAPPQALLAGLLKGPPDLLPRRGS